VIEFIEVSYRNFLSAGNTPITIQLNKDQLSLVIGKNGAGKTSSMDAISFCLFNKPYRNVNKPQLVNSINQKQCEVTCIIKSNNKTYKVKRGIKPSLFEIYENDILINQDPNIKDYQKVLEKQILGMNYRSFTQTVIMGNRSYIPFMLLSPAQRREFIEDLLDIKIFSVMAASLKEEIKQTKEDLQRTTTLIDSSKDKQTDIEIESIEEDKKKVTIQIDKLSSKIDKIAAALKQEKYAKCNEELSEIKSEIKKLNGKIDDLEETEKFYETNTQCPTCNQHIHQDHCDANLASIRSKIKDLRSQIGKYEVRRDVLNEVIAEKVALVEKRAVLTTELAVETKSLNAKNEMQNKLRKVEKDQEIDLTQDRKELKELAANVVKHIEAKTKLLEEQAFQAAESHLLNDSGIKAKIISQYIPVINKLVNQYLDSMDFFCAFHLDEQFNETVKSRHRDEFSYASFSDGQKMRIDLALLMTWRDIAKMKNSIQCNLCFFDELLDSSLDGDVLDNVVVLLRKMKDTNVFVISHRDAVADKFDNVIEMRMKNNFSMMVK
jgi:DNA repair exonuclease SbcCD ATPase subunit